MIKNTSLCYAVYMERLQVRQHACGWRGQDTGPMVHAIGDMSNRENPSISAIEVAQQRLAGCDQRGEVVQRLRNACVENGVVDRLVHVGNDVAHTRCLG